MKTALLTLASFHGVVATTDFPLPEVTSEALNEEWLTMVKFHNLAKDDSIDSFEVLQDAAQSFKEQIHGENKAQQQQWSENYEAGIQDVIDRNTTNAARLTATEADWKTARETLTACENAGSCPNGEQVQFDALDVVKTDLENYNTKLTAASATFTRDKATADSNVAIIDQWLQDATLTVSGDVQTDIDLDFSPEELGDARAEYLATMVAYDPRISDYIVKKYPQVLATATQGIDALQEGVDDSQLMVNSRTATLEEKQIAHGDAEAALEACHEKATDGCVTENNSFDQATADLSTATQALEQAKNTLQEYERGLVSQIQDKFHNFRDIIFQEIKAYEETLRTDYLQKNTMYAHEVNQKRSLNEEILQKQLEIQNFQDEIANLPDCAELSGSDVEDCEQSNAARTVTIQESITASNAYISSTQTKLSEAQAVIDAAPNQLFGISKKLGQLEHTLNSKIYDKSEYEIETGGLKDGRDVWRVVFKGATKQADDLSSAAQFTVETTVDEEGDSVHTIDIYNVLEKVQRSAGEENGHVLMYGYSNTPVTFVQPLHRVKYGASDVTPHIEITAFGLRDLGQPFFEAKEKSLKDEVKVASRDCPPGDQSRDARIQCIGHNSGQIFAERLQKIEEEEYYASYNYQEKKGHYNDAKDAFKSQESETFHAVTVFAICHDDCDEQALTDMISAYNTKTQDMKAEKQNTDTLLAAYISKTDEKYATNFFNDQLAVKGKILEPVWLPGTASAISGDKFTLPEKDGVRHDYIQNRLFTDPRSAGLTDTHWNLKNVLDAAKSAVEAEQTNMENLERTLGIMNSDLTTNREQLDSTETSLAAANLALEACNARNCDTEMAAYKTCTATQDADCSADKEVRDACLDTLTCTAEEEQVQNNVYKKENLQSKIKTIEQDIPASQDSIGVIQSEIEDLQASIQVVEGYLSSPTYEASKYKLEYGVEMFEPVWRVKYDGDEMTYPNVGHELFEQPCCSDEPSIQYTAEVLEMTENSHIMRKGDTLISGSVLGNDKLAYTVFMPDLTTPTDKNAIDLPDGVSVKALVDEVDCGDFECDWATQEGYEGVAAVKDSLTFCA